MKFAYTYEIYKLNIAQGHIEVRYTPKDESLSAITYNIPVMFEESGEVMTVEKNVDSFAPHTTWAAQKYIIDNAATLQNSTGEITP